MRCLSLVWKPRHAHRFTLGPGVVSSRYNILYDLIEEWIRRVPWLGQIVYKGKGTSARSKVSTRSTVARGIKDHSVPSRDMTESHAESASSKFGFGTRPRRPRERRRRRRRPGVNTPTVASSSKNSWDCHRATTGQGAQVRQEG